MGSKTLTLAALLCCLGLWGCKARYLAGDEVGLKQRRQLASGWVVKHDRTRQRHR